MKKYYQFCVFCTLFFFIFLTTSSLPKNQNEVQIKLKDSNLRVQIISPSILRITQSKNNSFSERESLTILPENDAVKWNKIEDNTNITISTDSVIARINKITGEIDFFNIYNARILEAASAGSDSFVPAVIQDERVFHIKQKFILTKDEGLYGLGQYEDPFMNYRGKDILIAQANRTAVNPFLVSTNHYGILWNNYSESRFYDGNDETYFWSEVADEIDYYFIYGSTIDCEIAGYRKLTGKAPMFGKWAYGYWQSKERYKSFNELIDVVKEYRSRQIPLDNIVQDWQYWGEDMGYFSGMIWDSTHFPNPKIMIDSLHQLHAHLMATIWPTFGPKSDIYKEMAKDGYLFNSLQWSGGKVYDAWNPAARDVYWKYVKQGLFNNGVDAFWMDGTEPEFRCTDDRYITELQLKEAGHNYLGTNARYLNSFSLATTSGIYEHQRQSTNEKRVFLLPRKSFTGQQRYAAASWSGDTFASWDVLKIQVAAAINYCMSGLPYWACDIGAFITAFKYPLGVNDDAYKELYVRWFQFGAFSPLFRSHGTNTPREVWQFGDKGEWAYDALVKADNLRYRLMPYIYSLAWKVTNIGYTIMRGLPMDFPGDKKTYNIGTQFMFGTSMMICPVLKEMYHKSVYKGIDITPDHFYSLDGNEHGLQLEVYRGTNFDSLIQSRKFESSQISWTGCLPASLDTSYSLKITGKIRSEEKGKYKIYIISDGGVKLWIDNKLIINKWNNRDSAGLEADVNLDANKKYDFKLFHKQHKANTALIKINWVVPEKDNSENNKDKINVYLPTQQASLPIRQAGLPTLEGTGKNNKWYDFWSGKSLIGGKNIVVKTPIDIIPIFIPAGSIIPIGPFIQYSDEKPADTVELRIYPGKDGRFELYEDENDNYNYEKGIYAVIPFTWNDKTNTLTIGNRTGEFPGMLKERIFNIVLVHNNHGNGIESVLKPDKSIEYDGKKIRVKL